MERLNLHFLNGFPVGCEGDDAFDAVFFQYLRNPGPVPFPHFVVRKVMRRKPARLHFFTLTDFPLPMTQDIDVSDMIQFRSCAKMKVQETDQFKILFLGP